jgi:hypothetical protein
MTENRGHANNGSVVPGLDFYVTGGTLRPDALCYIERQADKDLLQALLQGEFCYVLTSRQMGKSSLMVRTVMRLRQEGVAVAVLDLTAIGQNLTIEQWYDGLMSRLGQQLELENELLAFWHAHPEWGPLQRWTASLEKILLDRLTRRVVVFIDEIDIVRSLPFSTDEFFAAIRECYNRRSRDPGFNRLAFCLLGVAAPTDLIRDTRMTPFNIGHRIELNDFTDREAAPLAQGLGADQSVGQPLLSRVLFWTGGHPYLTQQLCRALAERTYRSPSVDAVSGIATPPVIPTGQTVNQLAGQLFLSRQARDRDGNLVFVRERMLRSEVDPAGLLYLYRKIRRGQRVPDNANDSLGNVLRLSGITRSVDGYFQVRNRIYHQVFDLNWIQENMPGAEVGRQRTAGRRGTIRGLGLGIILLLAYVVLSPIAARYREAWLVDRTTRQVDNAYRFFKSYKDSLETTAEIGIGGTVISITGSGSIVYEKPNKVLLSLNSGLEMPRREIRLYQDGQNSWVQVPSLNQYQVAEAAPPSSLLNLPPALARQTGPMRILPFYRMFLGEQSLNQFRQAAQNIQYAGYDDLDGQRVRKLTWEHQPEALLNELGLTHASANTVGIPVTAWVANASGLIVQMRLDLSAWAGQLVAAPTNLAVTSLILTEVHQQIDLSYLPGSGSRFRFTPTTGSQSVGRFDLPAPNWAALTSPRQSFAKAIPARLALAPASLLDLTPYYNASLQKTWHDNNTGNNLAALPRGLLQFSDVLFDVRGLVQLASQRLRNPRNPFPEKIVGVKVGQNSRQLHFLHATGWRVPDGTRIGTYVVHYADGRSKSIPIIYGEDVRDWNSGNDTSTQLKHASVVWSALNDGQYRVRLFMTTWENPWPETEIISLDYVSTMTEAAPFVVAITVEP